MAVERRSRAGVGARRRSQRLSMRMNHCGVLRKITGALERQEWG